MRCAHPMLGHRLPQTLYGTHERYRSIAMTADPHIRAEVLQTLEKFKQLVSSRSMDVLGEFAPDGQALLIGSEAQEVASGSSELKAFFARIFAREETFSWDWSHIEVSQSNGVAWFYADGQVVITRGEESQRAPYRITGVLERIGSRWVWRQYHGSEPA